MLLICLLYLFCIFKKFFYINHFQLVGFFFSLFYAFKYMRFVGYLYKLCCLVLKSLISIIHIQYDIHSILFYLASLKWVLSCQVSILFVWYLRLGVFFFHLVLVLYTCFPLFNFINIYIYIMYVLVKLYGWYPSSFFNIMFMYHSLQKSLLIGLKKGIVKIWSKS